MAQDSEKLLSILKLQPVVPVLIVDDAASAVHLARALVAGGLKAIEITMRTPAALDAIRAVAAEVEGAHVGAGTILNARDFEAAAEAGSTFIVSPGINKACWKPRAVPRYRCFRVRPQPAKSWPCATRVIKC